MCCKIYIYRPSVPIECDVDDEAVSELTATVVLAVVDDGGVSTKSLKLGSSDVET